MSIGGIQAQNIQDYLKQDAITYGLTSEDIADWVITDNYTDQKGGINHIYFRQRFQGIEVTTANGSVHIMPTGDLLTSNNQFFKELSKKIVGSASPAITSKEAVESAAAQLNLPILNPLTIVSEKGGVAQEIEFSKGGISLENIPVKLVYQPISNDQIVLAWDLSIYEISAQNWWSIRVNAATGEIIDKINWVVSCNINSGYESSDANHELINRQCEHKSISENNITDNCNQQNNMMVGGYNVFPIPVESPNYGVRSLILNPDNALASPYGWHDTDGANGPEYTITRGNNVYAYDDDNNDNLPGFSPDGTATLTFDFPLNLNYSSGDQSEPAVITNLFYWNNIMHDVAYQYGFDEPGGNFQQNNYGKGGIGADYVNAEAQDGGGTCNANMSTPPDGSKPRMQMYICGSRDGDIDNGVIAHEYTHGISIRLTGGPGNSNCLNNNEQMGEGWSDWYALMLTIEPGDAGTNVRPIGTWLFGQGPNGPGIRTYPYCTNMAVNPHTYNSIKTEAIPHGVGSVWCAMLWEVTWGLINQYGFNPNVYSGNGGNNKALAIVTLAMKLQPCSPGFVDGRDAILAADQALYGGANKCLIWTAFAKRGLGYSATQGSSNSTQDGVQAFDLPPSCNIMGGCDLVLNSVTVMPLSCAGSNDGKITILATSTHLPITYTITGPVNASNTTGVFPNLSPGNYSITLVDALGANCTASSSATILPGIDNTPPMITCPAAVVVGCANLVPAPNPASVIAVDNCGGVVTKTWVSDVILNQTCANRYTINRTYRATDPSGNSATCIQVITVNDVTGPVITCPANVTVPCGTSVPVNTSSVTAVDQCGGSVTISFVNDVISNQTCPNKYTVVRTYRATDICGNSSTCSQSIIVDDQTPPVFTGVPANTTLECNAVIPPSNATVKATDNCDPNPVITFNETNNKSVWPQLCEYYSYTITRTWTAKDNCGNVATASQIIKIQDTKAPDITMPPVAELFANCDESEAHGCPIPLDNCDQTPSIIFEFSYAPYVGGCTNSYTVHRKWTVGDKCGNTAVVTQNVYVVDKENPEIVCPANVEKVSSTPIVVTWPAAKAHDNCDGLLSALQVAGPKSGATLNPETDTIIKYETVDNCGNVNVCTFKVSVVKSSKGTGSKIAGALKNMKGGLIQNAEVEMTGDMNQFTTAQGQYEFTGIDNGMSVNLTPVKNNNPLEGVNTLDLVYITNHILGKKALDSPYKILAADVNNSGSITTADLVQLRKLILHIVDKFPDVNSWSFMPENTKFVYPNNPWKDNVQSSIKLQNIQTNQTANFSGIKMGDVTWDASGSASGSIEVKSKNTFSINADNKQFLKGDNVEMIVTGKELDGLKGMQFTLEYDSKALEFAGITSINSDITDQNFGLRFIESGKITGSIDLKSNQSIEGLFKINFIAKESGELVHFVSINSSLTSAEAYSIDDETLALNLNFNQNGKEIKLTSPVLYQNEPNPFENSTAIRFFVPENQEASLSIFNIEGKLIKEIKGIYSKGEHSIELSKEEFPSSAIYYYKLKTNNFTDTKKMMFIR